MGNMRSLPNKMDELSALTRLQREYRECSLMCFTETWLNGLSSDSHVTLDGFQLVRADRKANEGGHIRVKEQYCSKDIKLLADLNLNLSPAYIPMVNKQPPTKRYVRSWSEETSMALRDCFDTTDWDVLCEPHREDIDGLTTCITDYINFCVENTVHTRKVRCFPNNKPWVTPDLKALLNEKKRVFRSGDKEELRRVQKELRRGIRRGKDSYRRKLEERLKGSNAREV
ncbi:hypothetical protein D4764_13G0012470 [Takifugu flavidus]|uniref:Uncharacterized protein n=1 Tax=Takifugu flavidus TaxID=433684 RepID=A0A5C6PB38_9TELE|nr:hypothetical protein D4764_13G0012470 [Takifugu flavidus]